MVLFPTFSPTSGLLTPSPPQIHSLQKGKDS